MIPLHLYSVCQIEDSCTDLLFQSLFSENIIFQWLLSPVEMTKREKWCAEQLDSISRDTNKLYGPESRQGISSAINDLASMSLEDLGNALGDALRRVFDGMRSSSVAVQVSPPV